MIYSDVKLRDFIESGKEQPLTLEAAKALKGKTILYTFPVYEGNQQLVYETYVGDIVTEWDYNKTLPMEGYESRAAYWETYMTPSQIRKRKERLVILNEKGENESYCFCETKRLGHPVPEPIFACSDGDRFVTYIVKDEY